jgi:hypothetical protein
VAAVASAIISIWDRTARYPLAALYALGLTWLTMTHLARDLSTFRLLVWTVMAEWAGYLLTCAVIGWLLRRAGRAVARLRIPNDDHRWWRAWFLPAQAVLAAGVTLMIVWIAIDFSFDGMAQGTALFGLVGRASTCATALMLLGATIVMAWQSTGLWRAGFQYWAIAAGLMFTTSISWARIGADAEAPGVSRSLYLAISSGMLSLMTGIGFAVALPRTTDWIPCGRRAAPVLAGLSLLLFGFVLIRWLL